MTQKKRYASLLMAAAMTLAVACNPDEPTTTTDTAPAGTPEPTAADLLIGRWNMVMMDGQALSGGLYSIDEYRADGMYINTTGHTGYGTYISDSTRYWVVGDSIFYEDEGWGAEEIVFLDSLNLAKRSDVPPYGIIRSDFERM